MRYLSPAFSVVVCAALFGASAVAQTRYCLGGDLSHLSLAQKSTCSAELNTIRSMAAGMHAPSDWHFVLVCGEEGWQSYAAYTMASGDGLLQASADTDLEQHETFLRESRVFASNPAALQEVVAHEIAEIRLHSKDEGAIKQEALRVINEKTAQAGL